VSIAVAFCAVVSFSGPELLIFDPLPIFMVLALRTIPVATGMGDIHLTVTVMTGASGQHVRTMLLAAPLHCLQGFSMSR